MNRLGGIINRFDQEQFHVFGTQGSSNKPHITKEIKPSVSMKVDRLERFLNYIESYLNVTFKMKIYK